MADDYKKTQSLLKGAIPASEARSVFTCLTASEQQLIYFRGEQCQKEQAEVFNDPSSLLTKR